MIPAFRVLQEFDVAGEFVDIVSDSRGFINDTSIVTLRDAGRLTRYVLQRVNHHVFRYPEDVMRNLRIITDHLARRLERAAEELKGDRFEFARIVCVRDGRDFFRDEDGNVWRLMTYIEGAKSYENVQGPWHAEACGRALGRFLRLMSDLDTSQVRATIPGYHQTSTYLRQFDEAPKTELPSDLAAFVEDRRQEALELEEARASGVLKARLVHGDPRVNNIMIDERTGKSVAMIDLDTAGVGLVQTDFGDAVRSICNPAGEDVQLLGDVAFRKDIYEAFAKGFYDEADCFLTQEDRRYMAKSVRCLAFELGLRFLTDHLNGDRYFKVSQHGQNLRRAMGQFKLWKLIDVYV